MAAQNALTGVRGYDSIENWYAQDRGNAWSAGRYMAAKEDLGV
jgi:hypothetical protein